MAQNEVDAVSDQFAAIRREVFDTDNWRSLTRAAINVYVYLAMQVNRGVGEAWGGGAAICRITGMSVRQVRYGITELRKQGLICDVSRGGKGTASRYMVVDSVQPIAHNRERDSVQSSVYSVQDSVDSVQSSVDSVQPIASNSEISDISENSDLFGTAAQPEPMKEKPKLAVEQKKPKKRKKAEPPKRTPEQHACFQGFWKWWMEEAWPASHEGMKFHMEGRNIAALWKILENPNINFDLATAKATVTRFLADRSDRYVVKQGHQLHALQQMLPTYLSPNGVRNANTYTPRIAVRPTPQSRGEFAEKDCI